MWPKQVAERKSERILKGTVTGNQKEIPEDIQNVETHLKGVDKRVFKRAAEEIGKTISKSVSKGIAKWNDILVIEEDPKATAEYM